MIVSTPHIDVVVSIHTVQHSQTLLQKVVSTNSVLRLGKADDYLRIVPTLEIITPTLYVQVTHDKKIIVI